MWTPSYCRWYWPKMVGGAADLHFSPNISHKCLWRSCGRPASSPKWILCELREPFSFYNKAQALQRIHHFPHLKCVWLTQLCCFVEMLQIEGSFHFDVQLDRVRLSADQSPRSCLTLQLCPDSFSRLILSYYSAERILRHNNPHYSPQTSRCLKCILFFSWRQKWFTSISFVCSFFSFLFFRPELNVSKSETAFLCLISPLVHHALSRLFSTSLSSCW